jgi:hypothetical protein
MDSDNYSHVEFALFALQNTVACCITIERAFAPKFFFMCSSTTSTLHNKCPSGPAAPAQTPNCRRRKE